MKSERKKSNTPPKSKEQQGSKASIPPKRRKPPAGARGTPPGTTSLRTAEDLLQAGEMIFNEFRQGVIDDKACKCAGYLLQVCGQVYRACKLEDKIEELEQRITKAEREAGRS